MSVVVTNNGFVIGRGFAASVVPTFLPLSFWLLLRSDNAERKAPGCWTATAAAGVVVVIAACRLPPYALQQLLLFVGTMLFAVVAASGGLGRPKSSAESLVSLALSRSMLASKSNCCLQLMAVAVVPTAAVLVGKIVAGKLLLLVVMPNGLMLLAHGDVGAWKADDGTMKVAGGGLASAGHSNGSWLPQARNLRMGGG